MDERQTIIGVGAAASTKVPDNENMCLQSAFHAKDLTTYLRDIDKYIDNRAKTLAEIYKPVENISTVVEENSPVEENAAVEENSPIEEIPAFKYFQFVLTEYEAAEKILSVENIPAAVEIIPAEPKKPKFKPKKSKKKPNKEANADGVRNEGTNG